MDAFQRRSGGIFNTWFEIRQGNESGGQAASADFDGICVSGLSSPDVRADEGIAVGDDEAVEEGVIEGLFGGALAMGEAAKETAHLMGPALDDAALFVASPGVPALDGDCFGAPP